MLRAPSTFPKPYRTLTSDRVVVLHPSRQTYLPPILPFRPRVTHTHCRSFSDVMCVSIPTTLWVPPDKIDLLSVCPTVLTRPRVSSVGCPSLRVD